MLGKYTESNRPSKALKKPPPKTKGTSTRSDRKSDALILTRRRKQENTLQKNRNSLQMQTRTSKLVEGKDLTMGAWKELKNPKRGARTARVGKVSRVGVKKLKPGPASRLKFKAPPRKGRTEQVSTRGLEIKSTSVVGSKRSINSTGNARRADLANQQKRDSLFKLRVHKKVGLTVKRQRRGFISNKVTPRKQSLKGGQPQPTTTKTSLDSEQSDSDTGSKDKSSNDGEAESSSEEREPGKKDKNFYKVTWTQKSIQMNEQGKKKRDPKFTSSLVQPRNKNKFSEFVEFGKNFIYKQGVQNFLYRPDQMPIKKICLNIADQHRRYVISGKLMESKEEAKTCLMNMKVFSYREHLSTGSQNSDLYNDRGWGCMLRSGQMLLYNLLLRHSLEGVQLLCPSIDKQEKKRDAGFMFRVLIQYFDFYNKDAPFSFKNLFERGSRKFNLESGEFWDSPKFFAVVSESLSNLNRNSFLVDVNFLARRNGKEHVRFALNVQETAESLRVLSVLDGVVSPSRVRTLFKVHPDTVLVMPFVLRLGKQKVDPRYESFLFALISLPWFVGMLGGKKKKAFYIFGKSSKTNQSGEVLGGSKLLYLDPHFVQNMYSAPDIGSFSISNVNRMDYKDLNASICVVFSFPSLGRFEDFRLQLSLLQKQTLDCFGEDLFGPFIDFREPSESKEYDCQASGRAESESSSEQIQVFNLDDLGVGQVLKGEARRSSKTFQNSDSQNNLADFVVFESKEMNHVDELTNIKEVPEESAQACLLKGNRRMSNLSGQSWTNLHFGKALEDSPLNPVRQPKASLAGEVLNEKLRKFSRKDTANTPKENSQVNHSLIEEDSILEICRAQMSFHHSDTNIQEGERVPSEGDSFPRRDRLLSGQFEAIDRASFNSNYSSRTESFRKYSQSNGIESLENSKIRKNSQRSGAEGDFSVGDEDWFSVNGTIQSSGRYRTSHSNHDFELQLKEVKGMKHDFSKRNLARKSKPGPASRQPPFHSSKNSMNKEGGVAKQKLNSKQIRLNNSSKKYSSNAELHSRPLQPGTKPKPIQAVDSYELLNSLSEEDSIKELEFSLNDKHKKQDLPKINAKQHRRVTSMNFKWFGRKLKGCHNLLFNEQRKKGPSDGSVESKKLKKSIETIKAQ